MALVTPVCRVARWAVLLVLVGATGARAQEPLLKRLTTADGLSQPTVRAILQDRQGFMWFGTAEGLNRFDGYEFVVYKHDPNDPDTPASDYVTCLFEDAGGALWLCAGDAGVDRFDPATGRFTHFRHDPDDPATLSSNTATFIRPGRGGTLLIGTLEDGLNRLDPQTGRVTRLPLATDGAAHFTAAALETDAGEIWVAAMLLLGLDPTSGRVRRPFGDRVHGIRDLVAGDDGALWLGASQGLVHADPATGELTLYPPAARGGDAVDHVNAVFRDSGGQLWVGTPEGLYRFDPASGTYVQHYQHDPADPNSLSSSAIAQIYEDRAGLIWVGTIDNGVTVLDRRKEAFASFRHDPSDPNSLFEPSVHAVHVDPDGVVWIGTSKGVLTRYDPATGRFTHFRHDPDDPNSIRAGYFVRALERDRQGRLWVAGWNAGLNRLDEATGRFESFYEGASGLSSDDVLALHAGRDGDLWIGTIYGGLNRLDPRTGRFRVYRHDPSNLHSLAGDAVSVLAETRDGTLWAGTWSGGLSRYDAARDRFVTYRHRPGDPHSLPPGGVNAVYEARDGALWVGTSGGLGRLDRRTGRVERPVPFPAVSVQSIEEDEAGRLWLGTKDGILRFDPVRGGVRAYDVSDGLPADEFHDGASARGPDGRLYYGTSRGLLVFAPDRLSTNQYLPPVVLTELRVLNEPVRPGGRLLDRAVWASDRLTLTHEDYVFSVTFAALSYGNPEKNQYRYRLEGLEDDWNVVGADRREARYSSLPPGDYVFRVQGANEDGVWNEAGAALRVRVLPPWWGTWWFRSVLGVLAVGAVWGAMGWRVRAVERHRQELAAEVEARTHELHESNRQLAEAKDAAEAANRAKGTFLASMSHEFRTPLNAVLGFTELMARDGRTDAKHREYLALIHESGTHLLGLISDVLDMSKVEAERVTVERGAVDLDALLPPLVQLFTPRAADKGLALTYDRAGRLPRRVVWTDEQKVRQILLNLLSNAVKFTDAGGVAVRADHADGRLVVTVEDTGPGIGPEERDEVFHPFVQTASGRGVRGGTGLGLAISRRFAELLGGSLTFESRPGEGTTFTLSVPAPVVDAPPDPSAGDGAASVPAGGADIELAVGSGSAPGLAPGAVAHLPHAWRTAFREAVVRGAVAEMLRLVDELGPGDAELAGALRQRVETFDFDALLNVLDSSAHAPAGADEARPSTSRR